MKEHLAWHEKDRKTVYSCPIFSVEERDCHYIGDVSESPGFPVPPRGEKNKIFNVLKTSDWAIIIPELETERGKEFIMVRQWRPGINELSLEFPGGVLEKGEDPKQAAARELLEETGYNTKKIKKLGAFNPNPAIMSNMVHIFLAQDLNAPLAQKLDDDEYLDVEIVQWKEVFLGMGKPPFVHAIMAAAMALYLKERE